MAKSSPAANRLKKYCGPLKRGSVNKAAKPVRSGRMNIIKSLGVSLVMMVLWLAGFSGCSVKCRYDHEWVDETRFKDSAGYVRAELVPDPMLYYAGCSYVALYECCNDIDRAENPLYLMIGYWHREDKNPHEVIIHADSIRLRMRNSPEQLITDPIISETHNWYGRNAWHMSIYPIVIPCHYKDIVYIDMSLKIVVDESRIVYDGPVTVKAKLEKTYYTIFAMIKDWSQNILNRLF